MNYQNNKETTSLMILSIDEPVDMYFIINLQQKKPVYDIMLHFPLKNPTENDLKPLYMHRWRKENQTFTSVFIDYKY